MLWNLENDTGYSIPTTLTLPLQQLHRSGLLIRESCLIILQGSLEVIILLSGKSIRNRGSSIPLHL
jgi:hypothetical protein